MINVVKVRWHYTNTIILHQRTVRVHREGELLDIIGRKHTVDWIVRRVISSTIAAGVHFEWYLIAILLTLHESRPYYR